MTSRDFAYWLQGYFEIHQGTGELKASQVECIRRHLALVFKHEIDPSAGPPEHQAALDAIHHPPEHDPLAHARPDPFRPMDGVKIRC